MANIPVEKTRGGSIWPWLIGLLALLLVGWLVLELMDDEPDADDIAVVDDPAYTDDGMATGVQGDGLAAGAAITSLDELREARRNRTLYGRDVDLDGVRVTNVGGDSTFFIEDPDASGNARMLVVLENLGESETFAPGPEGTDGRYNINEGDVVDLEGRVERFRGDERQVTGANRDRMMPDSLYIDARDINSDENTVRSSEVIDRDQ